MVFADSGTDGSELASDVPVSIDVRLKHLDDVVWAGVGGEVEVGGFAAKKGVANRATDERQLEAGITETFAEFDKQRLVRNSLKIGERLGNRLHDF